MEKIDLRRQFKHLYAPSAHTASIVKVPRFQFASATGKIEVGHSPGNSPRFQAAVSALYSLAYALKFMSKQADENPVDFAVMPLEALWWVEDGKFDITKPGNWHWRALILQPDHITGEMFDLARAKLRKKNDSPLVDELQLWSFEEGLAIQILHIGPYATEPATVERMRAYAAENGYIMRNDHHEIYLGDPRKAAPEKLKTILRHPVAPS